MRSETLQSLSVGMIFVGLFLAALGGFGAFHFGYRLEQEQEKQRTAAVQTLSEIVGTLQEDQRALRQQVAAIERTGTLPPVAEGPPASSLPTAMSAAPSVSLASVSPPAIPNLFLPHPLTPAEPETPAETQPPSSAVRPPKLPLAPEEQAPAPGASAKDDRWMAREKRARLIRHLRTHSGREIDIRVAADDNRAMKVAGALRSVFREAGWSVGELDVTRLELPADTLVLSTGAFPPAKEFVAAYGALAAAGFSVTNNLSPDLGPHGIALTIGPIR